MLGRSAGIAFAFASGGGYGCDSRQTGKAEAMRIRSKANQTLLGVGAAGMFLAVVAGFVVAGIANIYPPPNQPDLPPNWIAGVFCFVIAGALLFTPGVYALLRLRGTAGEPDEPRRQKRKRKKR